MDRETWTWRHGQGNMDRETWTEKHGQGNMDMETWKYRHGQGDMDMDLDMDMEACSHGDIDRETKKGTWT
jgi:hypothetical protein